MRSLFYQFLTELRLYYRNKMALLYGYLFPTIFLVAFWVLYRHELVPLVRHMGELLTVTALGGACFGLPTAMVSERERGVWRRYRVAPVSTIQIVLGALGARYVILISAALLQVALAMWIGMPLPDHLFDLWLAFTFVAFAFLGLGLVIAMLADNVPAVQALGQSIFLPMLIIGGVAVRIESLPAWAQHLSAFFPGRYSVEAIQVCVDGAGLGAARFSMLALLIVGAAGCLAASKLFRWDAQERFVTRTGKAWIGVALAAWVAVGLLAEATGRISPRGRLLADNVQPPVAVQPDSLRDEAEAAPREPEQPPADTANGAAGEDPAAAGADEAQSAPPGRPEQETDAQAGRTDTEEAPGRAEADTQAGRAEVDTEDESPAGEPSDSDSLALPDEDRAGAAEAAPPDTVQADSDSVGLERGQAGGLDSAGADTAGTPGPAEAAADTADERSAPSSTGYPANWQLVTLNDVERDIRFNALPYDEGLEAPIAGEDEPIYPDIENTMECILDKVQDWAPAYVEDPVQRARNVLYIAAVPDMYQMSGLENWVPHAVFDHLRRSFPEEVLIKVLYWIATHPDEGEVSAADRLPYVCLNVGGPDDDDMLRQRTGWYAAKLLGRLTEHIEP